MKAINHRQCPTAFVQETTTVIDDNEEFHRRWICPEHNLWWEEDIKSIDSALEELDENR